MIRDTAVFEIPIHNIGEFEILIRNIGKCEILKQYARSLNFDTLPAKIPIPDMPNFELEI